MVSTRSSKKRKGAGIVIVIGGGPPPVKGKSKRSGEEPEEVKESPQQLIQVDDEDDEPVLTVRSNKRRRLLVNDDSDKEEKADSDEGEAEYDLDDGPGSCSESDSDSDDQEDSDEESDLDEDEAQELKHMLIEELQRRFGEEKASTVWQDRVKASAVPEQWKEELLRRAEAADESAMDPHHRDHKSELLVRRVLNIPFGKYTPPPSANTIEEKGALLREASAELNRTVHGMAGAKNEMLNVLAQMLANMKVSENGTAVSLTGEQTSGGSNEATVAKPKPRVVCLVSEPGLGKTLLATAGLRAILKRPVITFSMAGMTESSALLGASFFYEGSHPGSLYDALVAAKCMDAILVFDEVDKIADTSHGRAITNTLIHVTDPMGNDSIKDAYLSPITLDLSNCPMVFLANDPSKINKVLLDRMLLINVDAPSHQERVVIVKQFIWRQVLDKLQLIKELNDAVLTTGAVEMVITLAGDMEHNKESAGMRGVKKLLETVALTLNRQHLLGEVKLGAGYTIGAEQVRELVESAGHKGKSSMSMSARMMYT